MLEYFGLYLKKKKKVKEIVNSRYNYFELLLLLVLCIFCIFRFYNLDAGLLWQDEAEYSMIAKSVAKHGYPTRKDSPVGYMNIQTYDEYLVENSIDKFQDIKYLKNDINTYYTWLPFYLMAGAYKIMGVSTKSARIIPAIFGILTIVLFYFFLMEIFNRELALFGTVLFSSIFSLIYLNRLATHYSLAIFFELLTIFLHYKYVKTSEKKYLYFLVCTLVLFFHTQMVFFAMASVLLILYELKNFRILKLLKIFIPVGAIAIAWIIYTDFYKYLFLVELNNKMTTGYLVSVYVDLFKYQIFLGLGIVIFSHFGLLKYFLNKSKNDFGYFIFWLIGMLIIVPVLAPWWLTTERCSSVLLPLTIVALYGINEIKKNINKKIVMLALLICSLSFVDKDFEYSLNKTFIAIKNKRFNYGADWIKDFLVLYPQVGITKEDLLLVSMDNMSVMFYTDLTPRLAWNVNYDFMKNNYKKFWFVETQDEKACWETTIMLKDKGQSICSEASFLYNKLSSCKLYKREMYNLYECAI